MKFFSKFTFTKQIILFGFVLLIAYWGVWHAFFQQDEWAGLGNFFALPSINMFCTLKALYTPMFQQGLGHFLIFVPIINYFKYSFFGLTYEAYAFFSLGLHLLVALALFNLITKFTKEKVLAIALTLLFILSASSSQAVLWVGTSTPTQFAALFSILSVTFWFNWLNQNKNKDLILSLLFASFAINFKETALFLLPLLFITGWSVLPKLRRKLTIFFIITLIGYFLLRISLLRSLGDTVNIFSDAMLHYWQVLTVGIAQTLLSQKYLLLVATKIANIFNFTNYETNTHQFELYVLRTMIPLVSSFVTLSLIWFSYRKKVSLFAVVLLILSYLPLAFLSKLELSSIVLSSRNLYLPMIAMIIFLSCLLSKYRHGYKLVLVCILIALHVIALKEEIQSQVKIGVQREYILNTIKNSYPKLPQKAVFYIESDKPYYGLSENIIPFQSGFGQTLLVWYYPDEKFSKEFFKNNFLWELQSQDYQEVEDQGFGYFRSKDKLLDAVLQNKIPNESIVAFAWDSNVEALYDITDKIREELRNDEIN